MAIHFEKEPVELHGLDLGLDGDAAAASYADECTRRTRTYRIAGAEYRAGSKIHALMQHDDATGDWANLADVEELS